MTSPFPNRLSIPARVLLGGCVIIAVIGVLSWVGFRQAQDTTQQVAVLQQGSVDPSSVLISARNQFTRAESAFNQALNEPDVTRRAQLIAEALSAYDEGMRQWQQFLSYPASHDNETQVRDRVESLLKQVRSAAETVAVQVLSNPETPGLDQSMVTAQQALFDQIRAGFDDIEAMYHATIVDQVQTLQSSTETTVTQNRVVGWLLVISGLVVTGFVTQRSVGRGRSVRATEQERDRVARRNALDANLQNALDMADTEPHVYAVTGTALQEHLPDVSTSLMMSGIGDNETELHQTVSTFPEGSGGCRVGSVGDCPAIRRGQTMVFRTPGLLNACRYLNDHPSGPCSAQCVPVIGAGNPIGVLHTIGPDGEPPDEETSTVTQVIARKVGDRVGIIRAFAATKVEASTDPLTGLANRRSLADTARMLDRDSTPYSVAFGDLDRFKALNDEYGHDVGDQALRLFARVLRTNLRPSDFAARYGGEEFIVVFPGCAAAATVPILERVRDALTDALQMPGAGIPMFTVSFGVAATTPGRLFDDVVTAADGFLLQAKTRGRDRIEVEAVHVAPVGLPPGIRERRAPVTPVTGHDRERLQTSTSPADTWDLSLSTESDIGDPPVTHSS